MDQRSRKPTYRSVEKDIGMTLAHKDAGLYDTEARESPQPPGSLTWHPSKRVLIDMVTGPTRGGQTFWSFLPQYLVLRELLRSHDYRPIYVNEYRGYTAAQSDRKTYYGGSVDQTTRTRTPTYGTHGSFTAKNYTTSRYVQSGGFQGSAYASSRDGRAFSDLQDLATGLTALELCSGLKRQWKALRIGSCAFLRPPVRKVGRPGRSFGRRR